MTLTDTQVAAATLACMPGMSPGRLSALLARWGTPRAALAAIHGGDGAVAACLETPRTAMPAARALATRWRAVAPRAVADVCNTRGTHVWVAGEPGFPVNDPVPHGPSILLGEGDRPEALAGVRVAIVGTRGATPSGLADTERLAAALAGAGCTVVSGLAIGIDGAAHRGAVRVDGPTIGVIATGLDIVYPRRHTTLTEQVRRCGLVISESGFGVGPEPGRFPVRNRIIAALADVVVVMEATERGGARITAGHALEYGRPVLAAPGARRNPAAAGCNALLADGAHPLLAPSDVFVALGIPAPPGIDDAWDTPAAAIRRAPNEIAVLGVLAECGASVSELVERTGLSTAALSGVLRTLQAANAVRTERGRWWAV